MKFIGAFLLYFTLTSSRRLRRKNQPPIFKIEQMDDLDQGNYGAVYKAKLNGTNEAFVVKVPFEEDEKDFQEEIKIMSILNSLIMIENMPFFNLRDINERISTNDEKLSSYTSAIKEAKKSPFARMLNSNDGSLVMFEYDCTLESFIKQNRCSNLFLEVGRLIQLKIIDAFIFLHKHNIIHRDIKDQNIMIKIEINKVSSCRYANLAEMLKGDFTVAVIDFGFAKVLKEGEKLLDALGNESTMAPEVLYQFNEGDGPFENKFSYNYGYDLKADVYSIGVVLIQIDKKDPLDDSKKVLEKYMTEAEKLKSDPKNEYKSLFVKMISMNPCERPTIKQVKEALIEKVGYKSLSAKLKSKERNCIKKMKGF